MAVQGVTGGVPMPVSGTFSASLGGFAPGGSYISPLSVTNSSSNAALPTGAEVVVYNVGANAVYVKLGTSNAVTATTSDDYISAGGALALTVGSNTYIAAITAASTSTLNVSGGTGLPTGWGGGGGSGGGGTVTQGTAASSGPWIFTPWIAGAVNSAMNGLYDNLLQGNAVISATNGLYSNLLQGNAALSATNGLYANLLQGNAVLSLTNPLFVAPSTAAAWTLSGPFGTSTSLANSISTVVQNGLTGTTAGGATPSGNNVLVVQGDAAMTPLLVNLFGHAGTIMDFAGQNATAPANSLLVGCEFVTTPTTITTGHSSPCQMNSAGDLLVTAPLSATITNPTSTLTLPSATTAYAIGNLIGSSATAGSIVVPSFAIATSGGAAVINKLLLTSNDSTSTAWGSAQIQVDLWTTAPTFTNGDRAAFVVATGTAAHRAAFTCTMSPEYGDGVYAECTPNYGSEAVKLASGTTIYWTLQALTISGVTGASKVFTLTAELQN
jgi:hypothetical protein